MDFKHKSETKEHSEQDKKIVKKELDKIRNFAGELSIDDLKQGQWFSKLLVFSLNQYVNTVDAEYFKQKYPYLPPDAVVDARIKMASNYASIEGALTSSAYTGTITATIGSGGGASPLTLPAAGASFVIDLVYTSYLQLRMAYDISVLYGIPINIKDPDDTWKLIKLAFGIKAGETANQGVMKGLPAIIRPAVKKIFSKSTLQAVKSLPVIGKYLLQRNIIKFSIPAVTIPLTTSMNWWLTKIAGNNAKRLLRREAIIIENAGRIIDETEDFELLMSVLWLLISADKTVLDEDRLLLDHLTKCAEREDKVTPATMEFLDKFRSQIVIDEDTVWDKVTAVSGDAAQKLFKGAVNAAAVDGKISKNKLDILERLANRLQVPFDKQLIDDMKCKWQ